MVKDKGKNVYSIYTAIISTIILIILVFLLFNFVITEEKQYKEEIVVKSLDGSHLSIDSFPNESINCICTKEAYLQDLRNVKGGKLWMKGKGQCACIIRTQNE